MSVWIFVFVIVWMSDSRFNMYWVCLNVCRYLSEYLSEYLPVFLNVCLSVCVSERLSACLSLFLFWTDEAPAARPALARGRKSVSTNRSRQQLQREKALQLASKQSDDCVPPLSPDQQLKPPPPPAPSHTGLNKAATAKTEEPKPSELETVKPGREPENLSATVKELDKVEVELLVSLLYFQRVSVEMSKLPIRGTNKRWSYLRRTKITLSGP